MAEERADKGGGGDQRPRRVAKPPLPALYETIVERVPRTHERLLEAAEGARRKDPAVVRRVRPGRLGPFPGPVDGCQGYLTANRLSWWGLWPDAVPATGPLMGDPGHADDLLLTEFCSPLATVVGSDLDEISPLFPGHRISWDQGVVDVAPPNATPGLEFSVRGALPQSTTLLERLPVHLGGEVGLREDVVLFNDQEAVTEAAPFQVSLFLDFAVPQRAVALEYGYWGAVDIQPTIKPSHVELLAFGDDGGVIATSTGSDLHGNDPITALTVFNIIGLHDRGGAIRTVELRFYLSSDPRIQPRPYFQPHLVRRVWHEALPPAAVTQGTIATEFYPNPPEPGGIGVPPLPDNEKGPKTLSLPFRCNRAVVLMRGFKFMFLDEQPHPVNRMAAGIGAPAVYEVERGGSITFAPQGDLSPFPEGIPGVIVTAEPPPFRVLIYYTVLAWDTDQADLVPVAAEHAEDSRAGSGQNVPQPFGITVGDPCGALLPGSDPSLRCGQLHGGLQQFRYHLYPLPWGPFAQNIDKFGLGIGMMGGYECGLPASTGSFPGTVSPIIFNFPDLARAAGGIKWSFCTLLGGGDGLYLRDSKGVVLTGRSIGLSTAAHSVGVALPDVGPRPDPNTFFGTFDGGLAWPIAADMAFLSLGIVYSEPNGPLRDLEVELSALDYDGHSFSWQLGGGVLTLPPISNDDPARLLYAFPSFGGLTRKSVNPDARLSVQDLLFNNAVVGLAAQIPDQYGLVRNDGNVWINIGGTILGGPNLGEYALWLSYRGRIFNAYQLPDNTPIQLDPGEAITLSGWFVPQVEAPPDQPPSTAWIDFSTSSAAMPQIRVLILGHTQPNRASGFLAPDSITFGDVEVVPPGDTPVFAMRNALIGSAGQSPLVVTFRLEDDTLGFRIFGWDGADLEVPVNGMTGWQLNPGHAIIIHLTFAPVHEGQVETRLLVDTNDANPNNRHLAATLFGQGH